MEQLQKLQELFDKYKNSDGKVQFPEFEKLVSNIEGKAETITDTKALYKGVDRDGSDSVTKIEFISLAKAILTKDKVQLTKTYFRAYDVNKSSTLEPSEVVKLYAQLGKEVTEEEATEICNTNGTDGKLTYRQLYKNLYNEDLPDGENDDPYAAEPEEQAAEAIANAKTDDKSSKCCLLI